MNSSSDNTLRELDRRTGDGIEVRMLWHPTTNQVSIAVEDSRSGESLAFNVTGAEALEAFRHPYAYVGTRQFDRALAA